MEFKLNIDGEAVGFETVADAAAFWRELKQAPTAGKEAAAVKTATSNGKPPSKSLKGVMDKLNEGAKAMLTGVLNASDSRIPARMLAEKLGLDGSSLGGTRASFTKYLKVHRYNPDDYLRVTGRPGERIYEIPQDKVAELRAALRL